LTSWKKIPAIKKHEFGYVLLGKKKEGGIVRFLPRKKKSTVSVKGIKRRKEKRGSAPASGEKGDASCGLLSKRKTTGRTGALLVTRGGNSKRKRGGKEIRGYQPGQRVLSTSFRQKKKRPPCARPINSEEGAEPASRPGGNFTSTFSEGERKKKKKMRERNTYSPIRGGGCIAAKGTPKRGKERTGPQNYTSTEKGKKAVFYSSLKRKEVAKVR